MTKTIVTILGIVFVAIGLLGFVMNPLLGIFRVDTLHNIVHILSGVLALAAVGMGESTTRNYSKVFGVVYLLLGVVGFVLPGGVILGMVMNTSDHILHILLGAILLWVGFGKKEDIASPMAPAM